MTSLRTARSRALGLGSAHHGVSHFIVDRASGLVLIVLGLWAAWSAVRLARADFLTASDWIGNPVNAVLLTAILVYTLVHSDLGQQHRPRRRDRHGRWLAAGSAGAIGLYDGFFGPGTGSFLVFLFVRVFGLDFLKGLVPALFFPALAIDAGNPWSRDALALGFGALGGKQQLLGLGDQLAPVGRQVAGGVVDRLHLPPRLHPRQLGDQLAERVLFDLDGVFDHLSAPCPGGRLLEV